MKFALKGRVFQHIEIWQSTESYSTTGIPNMLPTEPTSLGYFHRWWKGVL